MLTLTLSLTVTLTLTLSLTLNLTRTLSECNALLWRPVNYNLAVNCPHLTQKTAFWGAPPAVESIYTYILTTDKAIITKLHRNIKQVKYYITGTIRGKRGVAYVT